MSVGLSGSITERLLESVGFMHRARRKVVAVRARITKREEPGIRSRYRNAEMRDPTSAELAILVDRVVGAHPDFKGAVDDEQWGTRLVTAYALLRIAEQNDEIIALLSRQNQILDEMTVSPVDG